MIIDFINNHFPLWLKTWLLLGLYDGHSEPELRKKFTLRYCWNRLRVKSA